jgi:VanZ family protein
MRGTQVSMRARRKICFAYMVIVAFASLAPKQVIEEVPIRVLFFDKIVHFAMYAVMAAALFWASERSDRIALRAIQSFIIATAYGVSMELLQKYIALIGRSFSGWDIVANATGAACAVLLGARIAGITAAEAARAAPSAKGAQ